MTVGFGYDIMDHSQVLLNHGCFDTVLITSRPVEWNGYRLFNGCVV